MRTEKIILPNMWSIEEGKNLLVTKVWTDRFQYAEVEVSEEQHFFFEVNGMQLRLSINAHGFTLWDNTEGQWILDASILGYSAHLTLGKNGVLRGVVIEPNKDKPGEFKINPKVVIDLEAAEHSVEPTRGIVPINEHYPLSAPRGLRKPLGGLSAKE